MCGIFGYFDTYKESLNENIIKLMGDALMHRGPDNLGMFINRGVALGNTRLSIIDLKGGNQPFVSEDENIVLVHNGEIYNYIELAKEIKEKGIYLKTNSDTEILLRLYQLYGINFLHKLNGMFAFSVYDKNKEELFIVRDRVGIKPLFYTINNSRLVFSSELKSLLKGLNNKPNISYKALNDFLSFNYVVPPYTIFENVFQLMPGHFLKMSQSNFEIKEWWDIKNKKIDNKKTELDWQQEFLYLLNDAVEIRLRSDVPYGAFLSGGVDSSTIVGLMNNYSLQKTKTFSIGFQDKRFDESKYSKEASERFNTSHYSQQVDENIISLWPEVAGHLEQPHGDVSFLPTFKVSELASRKVKVVLTGDGGDELFGGYEKYISLDNSKSPLENYWSITSLFSKKDKKLLLSKASQINDFLDDPDLYVGNLLKNVENFDLLNKMLFLDTKILLPSNNLVKPDRMGMAHSIEARTPFL
ncbi:asparagine synthase (glutamine-hydrolyzing), partial [Prochlorococcus sp. AH-716-I05]|nr:asparagine synthase (glutamine-hydrolyzing) [Prochlorococcus sp. AH-716-I05]